PIYLKTTFAGRYPKIRTVFTIHNIEYQGEFPLAVLGDVFDLRGEDNPVVEYENSINLIKGAIVCCDQLTAVSPSYADEIRYGGGFNLEPIILMNQGKLSGIINGINIDEYDPAKDTSLAQNYTSDTMIEGKAANKRALQHLFGLPAVPDVPLLCMVSRLVPHKGLDLLLPIMDSLLNENLQILVLGTGDTEYELFFEELALRNPCKVAVNIAYNPEISNKIYGGADIMLIPSRNEPCGLSQMIACRYGTIPLARATGGLRDTIRDCRLGDGNGFLFQNYESGELLATIRDAIDMYTFHRDNWYNLIREAMRSDFSWDLSAKAYADIYTKLK
ncbi:MAG: glycogen synthase, partial [Peptococcaceae bacterium]|nr:glycogen synthase [Peptococcaceae bacterium]